MVNCFYEITEQKKLFQALKTSEECYRHLIETLDTPLYTTDAEGRITLYNEAAVALWGREPEIGIDLWCGSFKILNPDGTALPLDSCPMAVCLKEARAVSGQEIVVVRPDGTLRHVVPHPQPLFDESGKLAGAINMLVDITQIKEAEKKIIESRQRYKDLADSLEKKVQAKTQDLLKKNEELRKSEERYHRMIEEVEDYAIILLDKNGKIQNWNKGAEKIKGYKEEEILGKNFEVFYLEEDRKAGMPKKIIQGATINGKATIEGWRLRKDGSKFWGSIVITALHNEEGKVIGFTKVTRDLTERKMAEDKLRDYSIELEFQNKELEQFAYAASHDMKEPLRKIHLYNIYIKDNAADKLDERSKDYLDRALNAVNRMNNLIEDLLAYSRATPSAESFEDTDFNDIIREVALEHKEELQLKNIALTTEELPTIKAIPFQCKQLMFNLVNNAVKYAHTGRKGQIRISSKRIKGSAIKNSKANADYNYYRILVEDNGIGFEQEYVEKIFEVFQRLSSTSDIKGSGIGLAICKRIAQNHKGFITATGKINEGAKFEVYLPILTGN